MEKIITKIVTLFLLCTAILFADKALYMEIAGLYNKIPYASKSETKHILHDLENFYINAVVQNDKKSIRKTLAGIVKCQKLLHLDSSTYEKELAALTNSKKSNPHTSTQSTKDYPIIKTSNIRSIKTKNNTIIIKFDKPLDSSEILYFALNKQNLHKDIYDIRTNLNFKAPKIHIQSIDTIKIAQNRRDKVRIVLENKTKVYSKAFIRQGSLFIQINNESQKVTPPKATFKPIQKSIPPSNIRKERVPLSPPIKRSNTPLYAGSKTIVIDAGHGGKDSGAVGYKKYQEKKAVLRIAKLLQNMLKRQGYKVYLTRNNDTFIKLSARTHFANQKKADMFISIHANAAPSKQKLSLRGIETFFLSPAKTAKAKRIAAKENASSMKLNRISKDTLLSFLNRTKIVQSNKLAIDVQSAVLSSVRKKYDKIVDGGVREAPFWVLVGAQMPAILLEVGYITNPLEADRLFNPVYQKALAQGIKSGINNYFAKN